MSSLKRRLQNLELKAGAGRPEVIIYVLDGNEVKRIARGGESILTMAGYEKELKRQEQTDYIIIIDDIKEEGYELKDKA